MTANPQYIVHPSHATKSRLPVCAPADIPALLPVVLPMMSPKAYAKLFIVPSLAELTGHGVSLRGMDLSITTLLEEAAATRDPPATPSTIQWSFSALTSAVGAATSYLQGTTQAKAPSEPSDPYWGQDIDEIVADARGVPRVIEEIGRAIYQECSDTEGIFRRTGNSPVLAGLRSVLNAPLGLQPKVDWAAVAAHDPLLPPTLLKRLLSHLGAPIVPTSVYPTIKTVRTPSEIRTVFLPALSSGRATLLSHVMHIAHHLLSFEPSTRMTAQGLAITLAPTLINGPDPREDAALCLAPGQSLPGLGVKADEQTLVGLLEMWIKNWAVVDGEAKGEVCECGLRGKETPPSPIALGNQTRSSPAHPVAS